MVPEAEPLEETLAQPSLGAEQPVEVGQVVAHLLDEFHLLIQEVAPGSPEVESARAEPRACGPTGPGAGSSPSAGRLPRRPGLYPRLLGRLRHVLEEGAATALLLPFPVSSGRPASPRPVRETMSLALASCCVGSEEKRRDR